MVRWSQAAVVWLLGIYLIMAIPPADAARDADPVAAFRRSLAAQKPFDGVVPRSAEPAGELIVLRIWPDRVEERIAIAALQGIVNRERPGLYIGIDKPLRWLEYFGGKTITRIEPNIYRVYERFKENAKGIVLYDNSLDALANVAITYAGIEDLIPADPELAAELSSKFGWKIVHDLRGRWKTRIDAYRWAFENLFPKCSRYLLTHYNHGYRPKEPDPFGMDGETLKTGFLVDYAVEFKSFCWHVPTEPSPEERELAERIFESVPFHTPIFGRSSTQDTFPEPAFVSWVAQFANLHIPAGMGNTSVLSGADVLPEMLRQKDRPIRDFGPDRIYVAFTNSEKDNLEHVIGGGPPWHRLGMETDDPYKIWWSDPMRGKVPIGWPLGPLVADLAPTTLAYFNATATENDYLMAALSGLCLSSPSDYGAAYPSLQDELLAEYVTLTREYMRRLGWTQVQPVGPPAILRFFTKGIPGLTGIMEGYGPHKGMTLEKADYVLDGVPVFHALTEGTFGTSRDRPVSEENKRKAVALAAEIMSVKISKKPAFIHAWTVGWDFGPTTLKMAAEMLPAEYVIVRPDELAASYMKYIGKSAEIQPARPNMVAQGRVADMPNGSDGLIVDTGAIQAELGWGTAVQPPVKRIKGVDGKWRGAGRLDLWNARELEATSFSCAKIKDAPDEKRYRLRYTYENGASATITITACAGKPYLLIREESTGMDLPSWGFDLYAAGFRPNTLFTDSGERTLDYNGPRSLGSLPWFRWMLGGSREGPERDIIGIIVPSMLDWSNGETLFWQREAGAYFEFYRSRRGSRLFAIAALDRDDKVAAERIWRELNGGPR